MFNSWTACSEHAWLINSLSHTDGGARQSFTGVWWGCTTTTWLTATEQRLWALVMSDAPAVWNGTYKPPSQSAAAPLGVSPPPGRSSLLDRVNYHSQSTTLAPQSVLQTKPVNTTVTQWLLPERKLSKTAQVSSLVGLFSCCMNIIIICVSW